MLESHRIMKYNLYQDNIENFEDDFRIFINCQRKKKIKL